MAAPEFVPIDPTQQVRVYRSPPRRPDPWKAERPGELDGPQPSGPALGTAGPDQGYAFRLVHLFEDRLHLGGVQKADAIAGCVALAMKRSALLGRAPVVHDLTAAFTIYGFLDAENVHHYFERRQVVDEVSEDWLRKPHDTIVAQYRAGWRALFES